MAYVSNVLFICTEMHTSILIDILKAAHDWTCVISHFSAHDLDNHLVLHGDAEPHRTTSGADPQGWLPLSPLRLKRELHHDISKSNL